LWAGAKNQRRPPGGGPGAPPPPPAPHHEREHVEQQRDGVAPHRAVGRRQRAEQQRPVQPRQRAVEGAARAGAGRGGPGAAGGVQLVQHGEDVAGEALGRRVQAGLGEALGVIGAGWGRAEPQRAADAAGG
jgi:hypothetical protein